MTVARKKAAQARRGHPQRGGPDTSPHDALVLLTAEHNLIDKLVRQFDRARKADDPVDKGKVALRICHAMEIYAVIKHEVLYPAAEAVLEGEDKALLSKASVRHDGIQELIDKVENTPADDPTFDALVTVLGEAAGRLMKQEEKELFPRLRHSRLDLLGTGERMAARKTELGTAPIDRDTIRQARQVMTGRD
jgi:Hemerythrin HHE cation binding domain